MSYSVVVCDHLLVFNSDCISLCFKRFYLYRPSGERGGKEGEREEERERGREGRGERERGKEERKGEREGRRREEGRGRDRREGRREEEKEGERRGEGKRSTPVVKRAQTKDLVTCMMQKVTKLVRNWGILRWSEASKV